MGHDMSKYGNVLKWLARIEAEAPKYKEIQEAGLKGFQDFVDSFKKKQ